MLKYYMKIDFIDFYNLINRFNFVIERELKEQPLLHNCWQMSVQLRWEWY